MLKREFQNNQNYAKVGVKDETEDPSGELGLVGCKKSEKQLILLPSNYLRQLLWRYDNKHWKIQRRNLVENQKKGIFPFESKNTRRPCFKLLSIFPPPPSLSQRQKLLSANSQMLKVFKTFVATASPSKALCCISFFPTFRWSAKCDPQLVSFHWNIGKLGEEEGCSGLRAGFNQFLSSFHHFLVEILLFTFYLHILTSEEMRLNVV